MADTEIKWYVRDDSNNLISSQSIDIDPPVDMDYVIHKQARGVGETITLWDSVELAEYEMVDVLVAPLGCAADVTVGPTTMTIPHGTLIYVIVGGGPDASCVINDSVQDGSLVDVIVRGYIPEGE